MTRIKLTDLPIAFEPELMPDAFDMKFEESEVAHDSVYEALELSYRTKRLLEIETDIEDGTVETTAYRVKVREQNEGVITFTLEDAKYPLSPSDT